MRRETGVITGNQLELLIALVLGIDAVVIAGIVISRLTGRHSHERGPASATFAEAPDRGRSIEPSVPSVEAVPVVEVSPSLVRSGGGAFRQADATTLTGATAPSVGSYEAPTDHRPARDDVPTVRATAPWPDSAAPDDTSAPYDIAVSADLAPPEETAPREEIAPRVPAEQPGPPPAGLDFGPTWVDPIEMAATAAAEWRHALRRDLARAAHRGRPAVVMHLKVDIEGRPDLSIQEVARLEGRLFDTLSSFVRGTDHVDRTGPGRFHLVLSEMPEASAVAVASRIRREYAEDSPDGPRLLIGWAAMESEADIEVALQRAAERVDDGSDPTGDGDHDR